MLFLLKTFHIVFYSLLIPQHPFCLIIDAVLIPNLPLCIFRVVVLFSFFHFFVCVIGYSTCCFVRIYVVCVCVTCYICLLGSEFPKQQKKKNIKENNEKYIRQQHQKIYKKKTMKQKSLQQQQFHLFDESKNI